MSTKTPSPNGKQAHTTLDGWPCGTYVKNKGDWVVVMSPVAHAKLLAWDRVANGLELSGFGILGDTPHADPREDKIFHIDDIILICDIDESSGGYTEMTPEQRFRGMKWARDMGRSANQLVWWHIHPIGGWSGTDHNTRRQRVHETGLPEVMSLLSIVLTPKGIRACWDQSGPNPKDNIYVDQIPVLIGSPGVPPIIAEAVQEAKDLLAERKRQPATEETEEDDEEVQVITARAPKATWKRTVLDQVPFGPRQSQSFSSENLEEMATSVYGWGMQEMILAEIIAEKLGPMEQSNGYLCRKDPNMTTDLDTCASCPFSETCFSITQAEYTDAERRVAEDLVAEYGCYGWGG